MANTTISPNMNLPIPTVGVDPGPDWATNYDACLYAVDSHNHTAGQGVAITPAAININADLTLNQNNLTTARSVRFFPQSVAISQPADLGCLYELGVDLYYIDGSGNQIRLTQGGAPAGATGTITGLPSGTASASFSGTTFTFESSTGVPASMSIGPAIIGQPIAGGFAVTLGTNNAQASNFNVTFPAALPVSQQVLFLDASGNLITGQVQTANIADQAVTNTQIADGTIQAGKLDAQSVVFGARVTRSGSSTPTVAGEILYSGSSGGFSGTFGSITPVNNLNGSVIIRANSLVRVEIVPDNSNGFSQITAPSNANATWYLYRDGASIDQVVINNVGNGPVTIPNLVFIDNPGSAGSHGYELRVASGGSVNVFNMRMIAYEI